MENFECQAPMYVNFTESSILNEDDGADRFFDCAETYTMGDDCSRALTSTAGENQHEENYTHEIEDDNIPNPEELINMEEVLTRAMKNLWATPKFEKYTPGNKVNENKENNNKRKGTPSFDNCQPSKFISMAEAVRYYQVNTPERFHSKPGKISRCLKKQKKFIPLSSTVPQSPNLTSHLRSRPIDYLTREQEEEKEMEEMRAQQIKANPLNPKVLEAPKLGVRVERKPTTVPVPFNLTEVVKKTKTDSPTFKFIAKPVPRGILEAQQGVPKKKEIPATSPSTPACLKKSKVYALYLDTKNSKKFLTEKEVFHFGVPVALKEADKRTTKVQPFSFEERDKKLLKKKEENIKKFLEEEKKCREFHATSVPASVKSSRSFQGNSSLMHSFKFEVDKRGHLKQEQLKQKLENEARDLQMATQFKAKPATVIRKKPFETKKSDRPLTDITAIELNTEKRAKERQEFDSKVKAERAMLDDLLREREEQQKKEEIEEIAKQRKEAVHKAKPMPYYRPPMISTSDKPLTEPHSPAFSQRSK